MGVCRTAYLKVKGKVKGCGCGCEIPLLQLKPADTREPRPGHTSELTSALQMTGDYGGFRNTEKNGDHRKPSKMTYLSLILNKTIQDRDVPDNLVVKNPPANAGGYGFGPWSGKIPHASEQLRPYTITTEAHTLDSMLQRSHDNRKPEYCNESGSYLPQLEKARVQQRRLSADKISNFKKTHTPFNMETYNTMGKTDSQWEFAI